VLRYASRTCASTGIVVVGAAVVAAAVVKGVDDGVDKVDVVTADEVDEVDAVISEVVDATTAVDEVVVREALLPPPHPVVMRPTATRRMAPPFRLCHVTETPFR
jgi:hypothetical protein